MVSAASQTSVHLVARIHGQFPDFRSNVNISAGLQEIVALLDSVAALQILHGSRLLIFRMKVPAGGNDGSAFDNEAGMWLHYFEEVDVVEVEIEKMGEPGRRQNFQHKRMTDLAIRGNRLKPDFVEAIGNRLTIPIFGTMQDLEFHVVQRARVCITIAAAVVVETLPPDC